MEQEHMTDEDVLRYLYLVERRLELLDAGVDWKTEYEAELEAVNQELKGLRGLVEREHERRTKMRPEIIKGIISEIKRKVGEDCEIRSQEVVKNNGSVRHGIVIRRHGAAVCPCIYIDGLLKDIGTGRRNIPSAAAEIADAYRKAGCGRFADVGKSLNKEDILKRVVYRLVNTRMNAGRLAGIPHKEILDLSAAYAVILSNNDEEMVSAIVDYSLCGTYGISEEELDLAARRNTKKNGFVVRTMEEILGIPEGMLFEGYIPQLVFTNTERLHGAAVMLYRECFEEAARRLKSDLYVLPASIHEVIAIPANGVGPDVLRKMVAEVNADEVADEEILSGNVYRYRLGTGRLEIM